MRRGRASGWCAPTGRTSASSPEANAAAAESPTGGISPPDTTIMSTNGTTPDTTPDPVAVPYPQDKTRILVETAMLASVTGLVYLLATVVKLEGYLGYILPLPIVLAAMRSGPTAARKTMTATCCLLLVLLGPVRMVTYICNHGIFALTLGALWSCKLPWLVCIPLGAAVRVLGTCAYLSLSSWTLNENLFALLVNNVFGLLDEMGAVLGMSGSPSQMLVIATIVSLLTINSLFYVLLMHVFYEIILRNMGYATGQMPRFVAKILYRRQPGMM